MMRRISAGVIKSVKFERKVKGKSERRKECSFMVKAKKILAGVLALSMMFGVCSCRKSGGSDSSSQQAEEKSAEYTAVKDAMDKLKAYDKTYAITNSLNLPSGDNYYIEMCGSFGSYREYPTDSDGGDSTVLLDEATEEKSKTDSSVDSADGDSSSDEEVTADTAGDTLYSLYDWITADGDMYLVNPNYSEATLTSTFWAKCSKEYATSMQGRELLFLNDFVDVATDWAKADSQTMELGNETVDLDIYTCKVPASSVQRFYGHDTLSLYEDLKKQADEKKDENMQNLLEDYISDTRMSLTFSDSNLLIGVADGMVRYVELESGGLGTRCYCAKAVILDGLTEREVPDFTDNSEYYDTAKSFADYVAQYDGDYQKAVEDMYDAQNDSYADEDAVDEGEETNSTSDESAAVDSKAE